MKLITAYIKPERLTAVKQELFKKEIFKMSITNALGCGQPTEWSISPLTVIFRPAV